MTDETHFPRPATFHDLKRLVEQLNATGVDYLLIGGYALFAHGYHRATEAIDLLVPMTVETGLKMKQALLALPEQSAKEIDPKWFEEPGNIRVAGEFVIDILFTAAGETWQTLAEYAQTVDLDGVPAKTVNLEGLLLSKQTVREKDALDRSVLERALQEIRNTTTGSAP
ncbi:MAG: hypothetical protein A3H32_14760 [Betaproteobacteria bacterium RIFCSPLOWO2_02_FULL_63_19]|nr:MAG: hypothetical protein A3H32_14760 [Betaproteobacteria bacterium RIFCSPLOWO2_02_FULL_63_19]